MQIINRTFGYPRKALERFKSKRRMKAISFDFDTLSSELKGDPKTNTVIHYAQPNVIHDYCSHFTALLVDDRPHFRKEVGVDLGCWLGLSTIILYRLGAKTVHGIDIVEDSIECARHFKDTLKINNIHFDIIADKLNCTLPIDDNSVDWVLTNDVYCSARPELHEKLIKEAARILRPGGKYYVSDENNPHSPTAVETIRSTRDDYERPVASTEKKLGAFVIERMKLIESEFPELPERKIHDFAVNTAYCSAQQTIDYAYAIQRNDPAPPSLFDQLNSQPPISPISGIAIGSYTDPLELERHMMNAGLQPDLLFNKCTISSRSEQDLRMHGRFFIRGTKTMPRKL